LSLTRLYRRPHFFYGWWMVALGGFITSLNKSAVNKGFPVFILPVEEFFGASRAQVSFIFALARSESGPTGPLAGWLVDRFGPRAVLFLGATMTGGGFLLLGQTRSIWAFAVIYLGVITVGSNIGFSYSMSALINNWFYRRKATAMSGFQAIDSLAPVFLVWVLDRTIRSAGLETASTAIGLILLATVLPLSFFIKNTPERMGLTMDGDPPSDDPGGNQTSENPGQRVTRKQPPPVDYSVKGAMRTPTYWILVLATALRLIAKAAIMVHIIPIIVSKGVDRGDAALVFSLLLLVTIPLYLAVGWLADRFPKNLVLMLASEAGALSFLVLASPQESLGVVLLFVILFAIAEASAPTNWAVLGVYFGRKAFGQLRGYVQLANFPGSLAAPVLVGWWYDQHASYTVPLCIFAGVFALGALTFGLMRRPEMPAEEPETATASPLC
jgi:OFA family oxalate/formate antiporter-like MFS transporter